MEGQIVDPDYEFEAPQYVNFDEFKKLGDVEDAADVDAWFANRPGDEDGIQIPVDFQESIKQENIKDSKRKDVGLDVILPEEKTPDLTSKAQTVLIKKEMSPEVSNSYVKIHQNRTDTMNNTSKIELKSAAKGKSDTSEQIVCEPAIVLPNDTKSVEDTTVEKRQNATVSVENNVLQNDRQIEADRMAKNVTENKISDIEKAESDAESQKESQTTASHNSESTEDEISKPEKRVTRAMKRNRSLNSSTSSGDVVIKRKKQTRVSDGSIRSRRSRSTSSNPETKSTPITVPVTPQCLKRQKTNKPAMIKLKTTEELEMECIAKLRKQTKRHIEVNKNSMKKAISCPATNAVRAVGASLTRPQEFHFQTDRRVKQHPMTTRADQPVNINGEDVEKEFWNSLRQHPPSNPGKHRTVTVPKPFNLSDSSQKKRKRSSMEKDGTETDSYQSMAYQVYKFQTTTPPRFRTRNANDPGFHAEAEEEKKLAHARITRPRTPNLSTKSRARPVADDVFSSEAREEKEVEEMKNYKFKAKPFDRRIIECDGMYGVKKPEETIALTKPKPFAFESDERLVARRDKEPENKEESVNFKALPLPNFGNVFRPELKHERTAPKPFSFEEKDKERWQKKDDKIQDLYKEEEKLREFKAQPLPSDSPDVLPSVSSKNATTFKPFALNTENRGAKKAEKWIQKVRNELEECRNKATFKAKPADSIHDTPFVPQKSKKPLTEVSEFMLNTNYRAERHEELEVNKKERDMIDEELRREREAEREREEETAIALLRKQMVHKAQPIHKYKSVKVKPSSKPLTEAHSPAWSEMRRRRVESHR